MTTKEEADKYFREYAKEIATVQRQTRLYVVGSVTQILKINGLKGSATEVDGAVVISMDAGCSLNLLVRIRDAFDKAHFPLGREFEEMRCSGDDEARLWLRGELAESAKMIAKSDIENTKFKLHTLVFKAYPAWAAAHPGQVCPDSVSALGVYMGGRDTNDRWHRPIRMLCGAKLPPGAKGIGLVSAGADGKEGTEDDLKSWQ